MRLLSLLTLLALATADIAHADPEEVLVPPALLVKPRMHHAWATPALGRSRSGDPEVLFTFDDGPGGALTESVLDTLKAHGVKALFFMIGNRVTRAGAQRPKVAALVDRILAEGHAIGNHTSNHRDLCLKSNSDKITLEIDDSARALSELARMNMTLFRAPFGVRCPSLEAALAARGVRHTHWDIDAQEWRTHDAQRTESVIIHAIDRLRDDERAVVLTHDIHPATAVALPVILDWIAAENQRRAAAGRKPIRVLGPSDIAMEQLAPGLRTLLVSIDASGAGLAELEHRFVAPITTPRVHAAVPSL